MIKSKLVQVGFWFSENNPEFPTPIKNSDGLDERTRSLIVKYLESGNTVARYKGYSTCRICQCTNGSKEISDEKYIWPSGLSHYVKEHHVKLPEEFIKNILER